MPAPIIIQVKLGEKEIPANARAIKNALNAELKDVGGLGADAGKKIGSALSSNVGVSLKEIGKQARQTGTALTAGLTLPIVGLGAAAIKTGFDFETSMNELRAATKPAADELKRATDLAKQLGNDLSLPAVSANDAAAAMTTLAKAGLSLDESMQAVKGSLQLASAAGIDAAKAAEIQSDAINTFKLNASDAGRVADLLAASANATSGEITDVADALKQTGAAAKALNIPIEDTVTALGLMAAAGIRGSDAGTSLKTTLTQLAKPSKDGANALAEIGFKAFDTAGKLKPLRQLTEEYTNATKDLTDQKRLEIATSIAGTDGQRALINILGAGVEAYDKIKNATTVAGEAQRIAAEKAKGAVGAYEALKSNLETLGLQIFDLIKGPLLTLLQTLTQVVTFFAELPEPVQQVIIVLAALAAAIGPLLVLFGTLISAVGTIAGLFGVELVISIGSVTGLFTGLGGVLGALVASTGPFGLAIIAAGLLAGGLYYLAQRQTELIPVTNEQVAAHAKQVQVLDALIPKVQAVGNATFITKEEELALKQAYDLLSPAAQERINQLSKEAVAADALTRELEKLKAESLQDLTIDGTATVAEFVKIQEQIKQTQADIELFRSSKDSAFKSGDLRGIQFFQEEIKKTQGLLKEQEKALGDTVVKLQAVSQASGQNARDFAIEAQTRGLIKDYQAVATAIEIFQGKLKENAKVATDAAKQFGDGTKAELQKTTVDIRKAGLDFGAGLAAGINSPESQAQVKAAARNLGAVAEAATREQLKTHSPSEVMIGIGVDIAAGLSVGIERNAGAPVAALRKVGDAVITTARLKASEIAKILKEVNESSQAIAREIAQFSNTKIFAAKNSNEDLTEQKRLVDEVFNQVREVRKLTDVPTPPLISKLPETVAGVKALKAELDGLKGLSEAIEKARNPKLILDLQGGSVADPLAASILVQGELDNKVADFARTLNITTASATNYQRALAAINGELAGADQDTKDQLLFFAKRKDDFDLAQQQAEQAKRNIQQITDVFNQAFRDGFEKGPKAFFARIYAAGKETFQRLAANALATLTTQILGGFLQRLGGLAGGGGGVAQPAGGGGGLGGFLGAIFGGRGAASGGGTFAGGGGFGSLGNLGGLIKNFTGGGGAISAPAALSAGTLPLGIGLSSQQTLGLTTPLGGGAFGGGIGGLLGGLFKGIGFGKNAGSGGALAGALPLLGLSLGSGLGGQSGLGRILGAAGGGLLGIGLSAAPAALGAGGAFASPALAALFSNPITAVVGGALLVGALLLGKAKQRKADESQVDTYWVEYMNKTRTLTEQVNGDQIDGAKALSEALDARSEAIALISQIKTKSVRESRLAHQIPDVDRLFLEPLKAAIEAQKKRAVNIKNIIPEFATGGVVPGLDLGFDSVLALLRPNEVILNQAQQARIQAMAGSDIFGRAGVPGFGAPNSTLTSNGLPAYALGGIAEARPVAPRAGAGAINLDVTLEIGEDDVTKLFVNGANTADGQKVTINTVKTGRKFREL